MNHLPNGTNVAPVRFDVQHLRQVFASVGDAYAQLADVPLFQGRYRLLRLLGDGGGGAVFYAQDQNTGRDVALKLPRPDVLADPERRLRFLREGQAVAGIRHPNVVTLFDVAADGPLVWLVYEYCDRGSLLRFVQPKSPTLDVKEVARLVSVGKSDVYIAKYDREGQMLWVRGVGGPEDDLGIRIVVDRDDVYAGGDFQGTVDFGPATRTATGDWNMFFLRLSKP